VRPLGESLIRFAPGPDLDDAETPWVVDEGRPPHHQFKGYSLDDKMRPRLKYRFGDVGVEDYPVDVVESSTGRVFLRRTITLKSGASRDNLAFRAATGQAIVKTGAGAFLVDDRLQVRVDPQHTGTIVDGAELQQLQIPLKVVDGLAKLTLEYEW
jgi:hypothetical protein